MNRIVFALVALKTPSLRGAKRRSSLVRRREYTHGHGDRFFMPPDLRRPPVFPLVVG
ncbi:MAG: hypothetical protein KKB20_10280 [Proteobacteria bacterium]|nr:hypothetical protein [Pseudomonadota bacterium]